VGLGAMFGVARRTAQRWSQSGVPFYHLPELAKYVHPHNAALAAEIALSAGTTLEALGLVKPQPAPLAPSPGATAGPIAPAPAMAAPVAAGLVEAVVCACADAMDLSPRQVRPGLHAAFAVAAEMGLDVQSVERWLRAKLPPKERRSSRE
jgi:hypothetical protein